ncbi:LOW QUALITY PROTEIN: extracellular matrix protein 3-like [Pecten maximus]|uniref:LOW QUALITY PROTEIN: extracellular matrix protein 3-like n=1 Tax=Pecten maximus TaxID=6579 RepID=UPI0014584365|nr:LOW QUALITY PROTEIN: extracellular matrix protein 3-like [Pecten maximus]
MAPIGVTLGGTGLFGHTCAVFIVSALLCIARSETSLEKSDILIVNTGIQVPFGRAVYVDPVSELRLSVRPGHRCVVTVLDNDPLSQRPGKLLPSDHFPCTFGPRDVQYTHFGARVPVEDTVRLLLRYDSDTESHIIPFTIHVTVIFVQLQVLTNNMPLSASVDAPSNSINRKNTELTYDRANQVCRITVIGPSSGLPRFGIVSNGTTVLSDIECDRFLQMGIKYRYSNKNNSPNKDYIPMVVELLDEDGAIMKQEYFHKVVMVTGARTNRKPRPSYNAFLVMEVSNGNAIDQFVMTAIPPAVLAAEDLETPMELLVFNITAPLGPGEGQIVSTDDRDQPIHSFYQRDVLDLKIAYKPPSMDSNAPRTFTVEFQVLDSDGAKSDPFPLIIVVNPMNTMAPVVTLNTGIQLFEGQSRQLLSSQNLRISDENNLEKVKIFKADGARHGELIIPGNREYFTPDDLDNGRVVYQHDHSDTNSDNIVLRMTDGQHHVEFLFPITIYPEDDEPPFVTSNTGLEIYKNQLAEISQFKLSATDIDSDDSEINFILEPPYSKNGKIMVRQFQVPKDPQNWLYNNGVYEKVVNQFTQQDILDGKVFYKHTATPQSTYVTDNIKFSLEDRHVPPNRSHQPYTFVVQILPLDDQPPHQHPNTKLKMRVEEFQMTTIKRKQLRYTDIDTNDRQLQYRVTSPLFDTDRNTPLSAGNIVLCENPGVPITTFTQSQVNHQKVCYQPPSAELGITARIIQFGFSVKDTNGNVLPDQRFTITLQPIDNQPPRVTNTGATVLENGEVTLTQQNLNVVDPDTDDEDIHFIVSTLPDYGEIRKGEQTLVVGDSFNKQDINRRRIVYVNSGEEAERDSFTLELSDGAHLIPVAFTLNIRSVDDEAPVLTGTLSNILEIDLEVNEGQLVTLAADRLRASDPDSDDSTLIFMIENAPTQGVILNSGQRASDFTQQNLQDGVVQYQHLRGEVGAVPSRDQFSLVLSDQSRNFMVEGNRVAEIEVVVNIMPVDNQPPNVLLGAQFGVLEGEKEALLPRHLDAMDEDSADEKLQCTVLVQPQFGYIENTSPAPGSEKSRVGIPVTSFFIKELRVGNVNYVQSIHQGVEEYRDGFIFYCSDGINSSPDLNFSVSIYPTNDEPPQVFDREFVVMEGLEMKIDTPILTAVDQDVPPDEIIFIVTVPPQHGQILQQRGLAGTFPVNRFSMTDIDGSSNIMYKHDDTETTEDAFEFVATDGRFNVSKRIPIAIIPVDDETPRLSINNGLEIETIGEKKMISNSVLRAEDLDSPDLNITFIIRRIPKQGMLLLDRVGLPEQNLTLGSKFTQYDIDNQCVFYIHTGLEGRRDIIKFEITDGLNPLVDRYFYVTVAGLDHIYPEVINKGVRLPEGGSVVLTTDIISGRDSNSPDAELLFTVTNVPQHGYLENLDNPGVPITSFTQLDLAGYKIRYTHTSKSEVKMDRFEFEVTDGNNPVTRMFRIALTDVDNKKPVLMFGTLPVMEGANKLITPFELKAIDKDTPSHSIEYTLTQIPLHGNILYDHSRIVTTFTQEDIELNKISYQHDGSETLSDSISFTVTDGTHSDFYIFLDTERPLRHPQTLPIEILPVDNAVPHLTVNLGATSLSPIEGGGWGFTFDSNVLQCDDRDSSSDNLVYKLTVYPQWGQLVHLGKDQRNISTWTQVDIDQRQIRYVLNEGATVTNDIFFFKVTDQGGNELSNQPFHLNWCWISFSSDQYKVNETQEIFGVTLQRTGYLGETSFVTITAKNGTARIGEDIRDWFTPQVQFNPGQKVKTWRLHLQDDSKFEGSEKFTLQLSNPVMAALQLPVVSVVTIQDLEDESVVFFPEQKLNVAENIGEVLLPVHRTGDLTNELMVICATSPGSASGTPLMPNYPATEVTSGSDYISRPIHHSSIIRFDHSQHEQYCKVTIIDDSLYEWEESFKVILTDSFGGRLGNTSDMVVLIEPDPDDEPVFHFEHAQYTVDESQREAEVVVLRTGTDLSSPSSVIVRSRRTDPKSAEAGFDYIAVSEILDFAPGVSQNTLRIRILDDLGRPSLEGPESFLVVLRMPMGASLGSPSTASITIDDSQSDRPSMQFKEVQYFGSEEERRVTAVIVRHGDISHGSSVRCYTRQGSAKVSLDFIERPDTDASLVIFRPGEREKPCVVNIVDDDKFEVTEEFRLVLGSPNSVTAGGANIGLQNDTVIKITDAGDKPVIRFADDQFVVNEPIFKEDISRLTIPVVRSGDLSERSEVRVFTKDGSARAGQDYNGFSRVLVFEEGMSRLDVEVEILFDDMKENREVFTVHLRANHNMVAEVRRNAKAMVYVEENKKIMDVVFPTLPIVVSLRDYDDPLGNSDDPVHGYPVICITPCNPKHPDFATTGTLCQSQEINDTLTKFNWRVAPPSGPDGVTKPLRQLETSTFFASTRGITLDSIYFNRGSKVQCLARAVNFDGDPGREIESTPITISTDEGLCPPRNPASIGSEPFSSRLRYLGANDPVHPNMVQVTITIPHHDGLLPVLSTHQLSNFEFILTHNALRVAQHKCSNLLDISDLQVTSGFGFVSNSTRNHNSLGLEPYQFSSTLRGDSTLRFYRSLDLESCLWEFDGYFDMSELVSVCGGEISTDGQPIDLKQSRVTMFVPLYVSYIFHAEAGGWTAVNMQTDLELSFVYDTAILWQNGINTATKSKFGGSLYPTSLRIQDDKRLLVTIRTTPNFRGQFVPSNSGTGVVSMVTSPDHPDMTFTLTLVRSDPTFDQPNQLWQFESDFAVKDYSGLYHVALIPCTAAITQPYTLPPVCNPTDPITFDLPIRFQQTSDPVPSQYSLNTDFRLFNKRSLWLSPDTPTLGDKSNTAFSPGDTIYGRLDVDPVQTLGAEFDLGLEKIFVCSGKDGYIPKYAPTKGEYGCMGESKNLEHRFKILDLRDPHTVDESFDGIPFNARMAKGDPSARDLLRQPGADGFSVDTKPLFQVDPGRMWFLHAVFSMGSNDNSVQKRSVTYHSSSAREVIGRVKRTETPEQGTNMVQIVFSEVPQGDSALGSYEVSENGRDTPSIMYILVGICLLLLICVILLIVFIRRRHKHSSPPPTPTNTLTVVSRDGTTSVLFLSEKQKMAEQDRTEV